MGRNATIERWEVAGGFESAAITLAGIQVSSVSLSTFAADDAPERSGGTFRLASPPPSFASTEAAEIKADAKPLAIAPAIRRSADAPAFTSTAAAGSPRVLERKAAETAAAASSPVRETFAALRLSVSVSPEKIAFNAESITVQSDDTVRHATISLEVSADSPAPAPGRPYGAAAGDTSVFMAGTCYIKVVLFESNGSFDASTENWNATRINQVKNQISLGAKWWEDMYDKQGYAGDLKFIIDFTYADNPFSTRYEPISRGAMSDYLWINEYLVSQGYSYASGNSANMAQNTVYNDDLRKQNGTDWAFTVYVADSNADADGMFADGYFGYAYLNGPYLHMTYDNDGWGIDNMQMVLAHEMGHIFGALDEYAGNGNSDYYSYGGYYNTQNINAYNNPNPSSRVASLMAESELQRPAYSGKTSSPSSLAMVGWQDSDHDGIIDVLDMPISAGNVTYSYNGSTGYMTVAGTFTVTVLPRASAGNSMTINTVDFLQYRVDGGAWQTVNATAWKADSYNLNLSFLVGPSGYLLEWRVIDADLTAISEIYSQALRSNDNNVIGIGGSLMNFLLGSGYSGKNNSVVSSGTMDVAGSADGTTVSQASATLNVLNGGLISRTLVGSEGTVNVFSGGSASATSVGSGGVEVVLVGGTVRSSIIDAGGTEVLSGGRADYTAIAGMQLILSGSALSNTVQSGGSQILSGGVARATVVAEGGSQIVSGGSALDNTVYGVQKLSGGLAQGTMISGGIQQVFAGATVSSAAIYAGGVQQVSGGTVTGTVVNSGGEQRIFAGAAVQSATVSAGGAQALESGGTAIRTVLSGLQSVLSGGLADSASIFSGGLQAVSGSARSATVSSGGVQRVLSGGTASGTVVLSGGVLELSGGTTMRAAVYSGGLQLISAGTASAGQIFAGASVEVYGGVAAAAEIYSGGVLVLGSGGSATAAAVGSGGMLRIGSGGSATGVFISGGGRQEIASGGRAAGVTVSSGGILTVSSGARLESSLALAGSLSVGGAMVASGCKVNMAVYQRKTTDGVMISDIAALAGAEFSITIAAGQSLGVYRLADNARTFRGTISVYNTGNVRIGTLSVGRTFTSNGISYSLSTLSGQLVLRTSIPPKITVTPSSWTSGNVTLSVEFIAGSTEKSYSLDYGFTWSEYGAPVTVSENSTVYFRSVDASGNESTAAYTVNNIDRTPPEFTMTPTATTRFSQVTIDWSGADGDGSGVYREYLRFGLKSNLSGTGVTVSSSHWESNELGAGVWYYQVGLADEAGNLAWSEVSSFVIGNQLFGKAGKADLIAGNAGEDRLRYGADGVWGGSFFSNGEYRVAGRNRSYDLFVGGAGYDQLLLTDGNDALFLDDIYSPLPASDAMKARLDGVEEVLGGNGNDLIDFSSDRWSYGDVRIAGEKGDDILIGNAGNDILWGGDGDDILDGGAGNDIYVFDDNWGRDRVNDRDGAFRLVFDQSLEGQLELSEDGLTLICGENSIEFSHRVTPERIAYADLDPQYVRESCDAILRQLA
ncbi:MAG: hypothetical protein AB7F32_02490 [Victivallaceae bacterium]